MIFITFVYRSESLNITSHVQKVPNTWKPCSNSCNFSYFSQNAQRENICKFCLLVSEKQNL